MASISGLGSGLDIESIISSLMAAERVPEQRYASLKTQALARQTAWDGLGTRLTSLATAARSLATATTSPAAKATSSDPSVLKATVAAGTAPLALDVTVTSLARAQQLASSGLASGTALTGAGTAVVSTGLAAAGITALTADGASTAGRHVVVVRPAGAAVVTGSTTAPTSYSSDQRDLTVTLADGSTRTMTLAASYADQGALLAAVRTGLGEVVDVSTRAGALVLSSRATGSAATLTVSGTAAGALGLTTASGDDGGVTVDGQAAALTRSGDTTTATALGLSLTLTGALHAATVSSVVVRTDAGSTVSDLASQLSAAGSPVSAAAIDTRDGTASPWRLLLTSRTSGSDGAVTVSGDPLLGLGSATTTTTAADAVLQVGGLTVRRSSNTITDLAPGVTLQLLTAGTASVSVERDPTAAGTAARGLVDSLNLVLAGVTAATNKDTGALAGQSAARQLSSSLIDLSARLRGSGETAVLSQAGISVTRDGTYSIDEAKLTAALAADPDGVTALLSSFGTQLASTATSAASSTGLVGSAKAAAGADAATRQKQVDDYELRMAAVEERYRRQYAALDAAMSAASTLKAQLTAQLNSTSSS